MVKALDIDGSRAALVNIWCDMFSSWILTSKLAGYEVGKAAGQSGRVQIQVKPGMTRGGE